MAATNTYDRFSEGLDGPAEHAFAISPDDNNDLSYVTRSIYVGTGGDIKVDMYGGEDAVTFANVPGGQVLPIRATRVYDTDTDATNMVGLY